MRTLLISLIALGLFTTSSCVNEGGKFLENFLKV